VNAGPRRLLALECATGVAAAAVVEAAADGTVIARASVERAVTHRSDVLLAIVDEALRESGRSLAELHCVAAGAGPGSFTGLRIALATAKGLCFAADLPLMTVSTLAALALDAAAPPGRLVVAALDAKKGELYAGCYLTGDDGLPQLVTDERAMAPDELAAHVAAALTASGAPGPALLVGTALAAYPAETAAAGEPIPGARATPSAVSVARLALASGITSDLAAASPAYLRLSEAELNWK
jgi:tRNA threonylcarbamoyladenosine biosynthesis protein TsaB